MVTQPEILSSHHLTAAFSCGSEALDFWLKEKASLANRVNTARVVVVAEANEVVGYYALSAASLLREDFPRGLRHDLPRHPIPMVLLARLAVDIRYQGQGLGAALVFSAINRSLRAAEQVGVFGLATNAKDSTARSFYQALGFIDSPGDNSLLIFPLKLAD